MVMALVLDLANIVGGFLLAVVLLRGVPRVGDTFARGTAAVAPFAWVVGVVALVAGGYYLIIHAISGPHIFHFEVIGIGVGIALLWDRLTGRALPSSEEHTDVTGAPLLLAVFGLIAIVVGVQGLFTPDW